VDRISNDTFGRQNDTGLLMWEAKTGHRGYCLNVTLYFALLTSTYADYTPDLLTRFRLTPDNPQYVGQRHPNFHSDGCSRG
jgi:hypothetical protein